MMDSHSSRSWRRRLTRAGQIAAAGACIAAVPATAVAAPAATHASKPRVVLLKNGTVVQSTTKVKVKKGVLAKGNTVSAFITVLYMKPFKRKQINLSVAGHPQTVAAVVRKGVNGRFQKPYKINGFACVPLAVAGHGTVFNCQKGIGKLGAVTVDYTVDYR